MPYQVMDTWGFIAAKTFAGVRAYRIQAMYVEFENLADPEDVVVIPEDIDPAEGLDYFDDLAMSGTRDYLRVPLTFEPTLGIAEGFESLFTEGESGNKLTFHAQTQGVAGVHGKTFSDSVNSVIYGAALVATPVFADQTQDVVLVRSYLEEASQVPKLPSSQVGLTFAISFVR